MKKRLIKATTCSSFGASWADVNFLYKNQWVNCDEIKKYGDSLFGKTVDGLLNSLLWAKNDTFDFQEALEKLSNFDKCNLKKISLLGLHDIWQAKVSFKETQNLIEELYCDCHHPEILAQFVSYMPAIKDGDFFLEENYEMKIQEFMNTLKIEDDLEQEKNLK